MRIAVILGPNVNALGETRESIFDRIKTCCAVSGVQAEAMCFDGEGEIISAIDRADGRADGIIINPGAYAFSSPAIYAALAASKLPAVEVHTGDFDGLKKLFGKSLTAKGCLKVFESEDVKAYSEASAFLNEGFTESTKKYRGSLDEIKFGLRERIGEFERVPGQLTDCEIILPRRATSACAGYDFFAPTDIIVRPGETVTVATGIRCRMREDYCLLIVPRSSLGFKYRLMLNNTVGVIDADYYHAENMGHIFVRMTCCGDKTVEIPAGKAFAQGIFVPYGITKSDNTDTERTGGFGSTDK